ncbi:U1 small nuclear ribonucleoprotein C-like [Schistocerca gregaria]|uniref:U1 small nuclear ribonucleoprotein C-like n=1 Tax=Schistocerca gregaria TaxID=7010 RepID=UPI00211DFC41|nr:U1 small nuclear ribonucleoprotein C-like [Schistocerca gregaria]
MPKYYCDYCDTFLTHDSTSVRKSHIKGNKHRAAVLAYYEQFNPDRQREEQPNLYEALGVEAMSFPPMPFVGRVPSGQYAFPSNAFLMAPVFPPNTMPMPPQFRSTGNRNDRNFKDERARAEHWEDSRDAHILPDEHMEMYNRNSDGRDDRHEQRQEGMNEDGIRQERSGDRFNGSCGDMGGFNREDQGNNMNYVNSNSTANLGYSNNYTPILPFHR